MNIELSYTVDHREAFQELEPIRGPVTREMILRLEAAMREFPQEDAPVVHHFSEGIYARELRIPRGALLTGKIHRKPHISVLSHGEITVLTEAGMKRLKAPCTILSEPGIKRVGYAHTDVVWTTFHATDETDLDKIEAEFIAPDYAALEAPTKMLEVSP
jgi:hypothetical protein